MLHQNRLIVLLSLGFLSITFTEAMFIVFWYTNTQVLLLKTTPYFGPKGGLIRES